MKSAVLLAILVSVLAFFPRVARCDWQKFSVADGMGGNTVSQILEDRSGNIWVCPGRTYTGNDDLVSRYDGFRWTIFPFYSERLFEDSAGYIWAATLDGAARFDGTQWTQFGKTDAPIWYARAILENRPGSIWVAGSGGIGHYDETGWTEFHSGDDLPQGNVDYMVADVSGDVFACGHYDSYTDGSTWVIRYRDGNWSTIAYLDRITAGFSGMLAGRTGGVWVTAGGLVNHWDGEAWAYPFGTSFSSGQTTLLEGDDGTLWLGWDGLYLTRDGVYSRVDYLAGRRIRQIFRSRSGAMWVAWSQWSSSQGGVSSYELGNWKTIATVDNVQSIGNLMEDAFGRIWFTASSGSIPVSSVSSAYKYDGFTLTQYTGADGFLGSGVAASTSLADRTGNVWVGSAGGLCRGDGEGVSSIPTPESLGIPNAIRDRSGSLWFTTGAKGLFRFDGNAWAHYDSSNGLSGVGVFALLEDSQGSIWASVFQKPSVAVGVLQRFDGMNWSILPYGFVLTMIEDDQERVWFGSTGGLVRYDPHASSSWKILTTADGAPSDTLRPILKERSGALWFTDPSTGLSRLDGSVWQTFRMGVDLPPYPSSLQALEDLTGNIWVVMPKPPDVYDHTGAASGGSPDTLDDISGTGRYDGNSWTWYPQIEGTLYGVDPAGGVWCSNNRFDGTNWTAFPNLYGYHIVQDGRGCLWFNSRGGAARFDGVNWSYYPTMGFAYPIVEDRAGCMWFTGSGSSLIRYSPDRVPSKSVFLSRPPLLTTATTVSAAFAAAFGETRGVEFSYSLDDGPWSVWSPAGAWTGSGLPDGPHVLAVRSHDADWNVEASPATVRFEVDATPPAPVLQSPSFGSPVRGVIEITGAAQDSRFLRYRVELRAAGSTSWNPPIASVIAESGTPVPEGTLATWDTSLLPDGLYDLRLSVSDTLGVTGTDQVTVIVDNEAPFADRTTPALVTAAAGGDVYTTDAEFHLYVPPHGFSKDAVVTIHPMGDGSADDSLENGATWTGTGYTLAWEAPLQKAAAIDLAVPGARQAAAENAGLSIYHSANGGSWTRVGGTLDASGVRISTVVTEPGSYAVYRESEPVRGGETLTSLAFTPRVFSPGGTYADRQVAISFSLGTAAPVTVKVYDPSGRLIRELMSDEVMGPGTNLVRWDGHNRDGATVGDGLYLVTVEAFGEVRKKTLAVVR